ncbi:MAG: hypothetical protein H7X80_00220 [bacterium]|nr:hypothetical protein [Candidatus Kapabacteria bacterium]
MSACALAQVPVRATDSTISQKWTSEYGYSVLLPSVAKYNKIGSTYTKGGGTEKVNFILPGGSGAITLTHVTEPRMVPKDFRLLDSVHFYQYDSLGRNGTIHRRVYVLKENAIQFDVLLTDKGERNFGALVNAIFDSFVPAPGAVFALESWRYGRDPREFEQGRYGSGSGPGH